MKRSGGDPADEITAEISTETQREENETSVTDSEFLFDNNSFITHI